ncbi:MAG TPA: RNA polymerase sigma factor [Tepidisphaeraceae bacterium]|jgi:RNA polymerase sigma-70 factor (ECF subfamily)|nr:RNA polymerase sigma factor [Tepidisphaeraceae bacterium]
MPPAAENDRTDPELVRLARRGDAQAFHDLIDRHSGWLFRVAIAMVGSREDAEDLIQEVFLAASRGMARFEERSSVKTWLRSILLNHVSKLYRSRKVRRHWSLDDERGEAVRAEMEASIPNPAAATESKADVQAMLQALSDEHREVIVLREIDGLSYEEMAKLLRLPRGTVESRLHRARQQLKEKFAGYLEGTDVENDG